MVHILAKAIESKIFVEPFGGPETLLFERKPAPVEVYNDYSGDLINLFEVIRDPILCQRFVSKISTYLPLIDKYRQAEDALANNQSRDTRAWALFVLHMRNFDQWYPEDSRWQRNFQLEGDATKSISGIQRWHSRISRAQIDCRPPHEVITYWDSDETYFYITPYTFDVSDDLLNACSAAKGQIVINSARHYLLDNLDWQFIDNQYINKIALERNNWIGTGIKMEE